MPFSWKVESRLLTKTLVTFGQLVKTGILTVLQCAANNYCMSTLHVLFFLPLILCYRVAAYRLELRISSLDLQLERLKEFPNLSLDDFAVRHELKKCEVGPFVTCLVLMPVGHTTRVEKHSPWSDCSEAFADGAGVILHPPKPAISRATTTL